MLDAEEYLHLALESSRAGEHQTALEQLHKCLEQDSDNAKATFLLAAEHAELGLYDRAIEGMERALAIDPELEMAMLQLGMLYVRGGVEDKAVPLWKQLEETTSESSLQSIASGFMLLCEGNTEKALTHLREGIAANTVNPALNTAIEAVANNVQEQLGDPGHGDEDRDSEGKGRYIGAYSHSAIGDEP